MKNVNSGTTTSHSSIKIGDCKTFFTLRSNRSDWWQNYYLWIITVAETCKNPGIYIIVVVGKSQGVEKHVNVQNVTFQLEQNTAFLLLYLKCTMKQLPILCGQKNTSVYQK